MNYFEDEDFCEYVKKSVSPNPKNVNMDLIEKLVDNSSYTVKQLFDNFNKKNEKN